MKFTANTVSKPVAGKEAKKLANALRRNSSIRNKQADVTDNHIVRMALQFAD